MVKSVGLLGSKLALGSGEPEMGCWWLVQVGSPKHTGPSLLSPQTQCSRLAHLVVARAQGPGQPLHPKALLKGTTVCPGLPGPQMEPCRHATIKNPFFTHPVAPGDRHRDAESCPLPGQLSGPHTPPGSPQRVLPRPHCRPAQAVPTAAPEVLVEGRSEGMSNPPPQVQLRQGQSPR